MFEAKVTVASFIERKRVAMPEIFLYAYETNLMQIPLLAIIISSYIGNPMTRRIQRKPKRYLSERTSKAPTTANRISIQEAVSILGGITGIIVATLWLAGRFYMAGYFSAMNIPAFQINFSVWEYAEAAWSRVILYFLINIFVPLVLASSVALASLVGILTLQRMFPKLKLVGLLDGITVKAQNLPRRFKSVLTFVLIIYLIYILLDLSTNLNASGQEQGRITVLTRSYAVEVFSKEYLALGSPEIMSNTTPTLMHYRGLRLLTFNNGKYYLFRDVDPVTCRPAQVFIISDNADVHLTVSPITPVEAPCAGTAVETPDTDP